MKRIAVLMTVFNRKDKTIKCLDCLYGCVLPNGYCFDVFLTNDGCTDGTPQAVENKYPRVKILQGNGNLFWARGMRLAWEEAAKNDYDYYLWLNDDTFLFKDALENILSTSENVGDRAILVGPTMSINNSVCTYGISVNGKLLIPDGNIQEGYEMNGNFVLISKKVYQVLGNIDRHYHHAGGDTHYGLLAQKNGIPVYLIEKYIGTCESHEKLPKWTDPDVPFKERWRDLNRPNGMPLNMLFYQQRTFYGLHIAIFHLVTTVLRCSFPRLYIKAKRISNK